MQNTKSLTIMRGIKDAIPVMLGYIPVGLLLGSQAVEKGFEIWQVPFMTGLNFAGGSEFAVVEVWSNPPNIALILAITLLINSRHFVMGATLVPYWSHLPKTKSLPALFFMVDESWALGLNDAKKHHCFSMTYYITIVILFYFTWTFFPYLGAVLQHKIGDIATYGFGMAFPAVFLVLIFGMWQGYHKAIAWLVALVVACLAYVFLPKGWYVACGTAAGLISAYFLAKEE